MNKRKIITNAVLVATMTTTALAPSMANAQEIVNKEIDKTPAKVIQEQPQLTIEKALENSNKAEADYLKVQGEYNGLSTKGKELADKKSEVATNVDSHKTEIGKIDIAQSLAKLKEATEKTLAEKTAELETATKNVEDSERELTEAKATLAEKTSKKAELEAQIDELKAQHEGIEEYAEKKAQVEVLEQEKSGLEAEITQITGIISSLTTDKATNEETARQLTATVETLTREVEGLKANVGTAEAQYNEAKTAYDEALNNEASTKEELETLKANLETKEAELAQAKTAITEAEAKLANAEKQLNDQLAPSETEVKLQARVDKAQGELNELQTELDTAKVELKDIEGKIAEKDNAIAQAESELATLNSDITNLEDTIKNLEASKSDKVKAYEEAVKARDAVSQYRTDFISIFDSHGATGYHMQDYMDWLTKTAVKDVKLKIVDEDLQRVFGKTEITVGELAEHPVFKADMEYGFSKEGLLKRLDLIDEGNRKRVLDGQSVLPVSYVLMLQSQLASAINPVEATHAMAFHLNSAVHKAIGSENLAMGTNQPFEEWYTWEKAVYDYVREHYPTEQPGQAAKAHADEILRNVKPSVPGTGGYSITGHYTNLVDSQHIATGIGLAPEHTLNRGEVRNNINRPSVMHHFVDNWNKPAGDTVKTTDEVRAEIEKLSKELNPKWVELNRKVEEALNNLTTDDKQVIETLKTKRAELDGKKAEIAPKNEQIKQLGKAKAELTAKLPRAQEKVTDATGYVDWAKGELAQKEKALADYKESHKPSQAVIDGIKKLIEGYKAELEQAKTKKATAENDINTIKARQAELKEVLDRAGVTDKENAMNDKKAEFDRLSDELASKSEELKSKQSENEALATEIARLEEVITKATATKAEKADRVTKIDEEIAGIALPNIDENVYNDYKAKKAEVAKLGTDIEDLNTAIAQKEEMLKELKNTKTILSTEVDKIQAEIDSLNKVNADDPATYKENASIQAEYDKLQTLKAELEALETELANINTAITDIEPKIEEAKTKLIEKKAEYEKQHKIYMAMKAEADAKAEAEKARIEAEKAKREAIEKKAQEAQQGVPNTGDSNSATAAVTLFGSSMLAGLLLRKKHRDNL